MTSPAYTDHIFSTKSGVPLPLRIWPAPSPPASASTPSPTSTPLPWLLWTHGGAYISGNPYIPRTWVIPSFHTSQFHIISLGYRLSPHVSLHDQLQDCLDGYQWCLIHLERILGSGRVDLGRFVVGGESAGGTLSTLLGCKLEPRPRAVLNVFGLVDLPKFLEWSLRKSPVVLPKEEGEFTQGEIIEYMGARDETKARTFATYYGEIHNCTEGEMSDKWGVEVVFDEALRKHVEMKSFTDRHHGLTTIPMIMRFDDHTPDEDRQRRMKEVSSAYHLDEGYPPMGILHGTGDTVVPVEQSYELAKKLKALGVDVVERYCPGAEHGWEEIYKPGDEGWNEYIQPLVDFAVHHARA